MRYFVVLLLSILLTACASPSIKGSADNKFAKNFQAPSQLKKVLLLPLESHYVEFTLSALPIKDELSKQLGHAGYQPVPLDENIYRNIWNKEVAAVGGIYDSQTGSFRPQAYFDALSALVKRTTTVEEYSLVIVPRLVLKTATYSGRYATWDGVTRRQDDTLVSYSSAMTYDGTTTGLSMELIAFNSEGVWQFTTFGGILLPYQINIKKKRNELRKDLFSSPEEIEEAVDVALTPLSNVVSDASHDR